MLGIVSIPSYVLVVLLGLILVLTMSVVSVLIWTMKHFHKEFITMCNRLQSGTLHDYAIHADMVNDPAVQENVNDFRRQVSKASSDNANSRRDVQPGEEDSGYDGLAPDTMSISMAPELQAGCESIIQKLGR